MLVCGLIINNPNLVTWHAKLRGMQNETYAQTLREFKGLVAELTFAMKSFFFLLLGYWTDVRSMLSIEALLVAIAGIAAILATRWVILKALRRQRDSRSSCGSRRAASSRCCCSCRAREPASSTHFRSAPSCSSCWSRPR